MVNLPMLATVIFILRVWSPGRNIIVVLVVKYNSASCAYSYSVAQVELSGQDEHKVLAVGVTQYTLLAEQQGNVPKSSASAATRAMNDVDIVTL